MTVHAVKVFTEVPDGVPIQDVRDAVSAWVDSHEEVVVENRQEVSQYGGGGVPEYIYGEFRFANTESKSNLLGRIENALSQVVSWYVLRYHGCTHDGTGGTCPEGQLTEWGSVPPEVPRI